MRSLSKSFVFCCLALASMLIIIDCQHNEIKELKTKYEVVNSL